MALNVCSNWYSLPRTSDLYGSVHFHGVCIESYKLLRWCHTQLKFCLKNGLCFWNDSLEKWSKGARVSLYMTNHWMCISQVYTCRSRSSSTLEFLKSWIKSESKVAAMSLILDIRLHPHQIGTNTWSGTEVIFTLVLLAHAFGTYNSTATFNLVFYVAVIPYNKKKTSHKNYKRQFLQTLSMTWLYIYLV